MRGEKFYQLHTETTTAAATFNIPEGPEYEQKIMLLVACLCPRVVLQVTVQGYPEWKGLKHVNC